MQSWSYHVFSLLPFLEQGEKGKEVLEEHCPEVTGHELPAKVRAPLYDIVPKIGTLECCTISRQ